MRRHDSKPKRRGASLPAALHAFALERGGVLKKKTEPDAPALVFILNGKMESVHRAAFTTDFN